MIDALLLALAAALGGWSCLLAWSAWRLFAAILSVGLLLGALELKRVGLVVASAAVAVAGFLSLLLDAEGSRLWHALGFGVLTFVLVEVSWDRVRMLDARFTRAAYARRLGYLARTSALSAAILFVAVTLGYSTAERVRLSVPFVVAIGAVALSVAGVAAVVFRALKRAQGSQAER